MTITNHSLILFLAIAAGILGQMLLSALKRPCLAYRVGQVVLTVFWAGLGAALLVGGVTLFAQGAILPGVGNLALGLGLALMGIGYALEKPALRGTGVAVVGINAGGVYVHDPYGDGCEARRFDWVSWDRFERAWHDNSDPLSRDNSEPVVRWRMTVDP